MKAKILKDSITKNGNRVTTFELEYPRYIHSQIMTHRVASKNCASSRAIPIQKNIDFIKENFEYPMWTLSKSGMQGDTLNDKDLTEKANALWYKAFEYMSSVVLELKDLGIHKQNANRLLEPFQTIKVVFTSSLLENFFKLRIHPHAQLEIQEIACKMRDCLNASTPTLLEDNMWHLPYIDYEVDWGNVEEVEKAKKISASCCAQVSYRKLDQTEEKALDIYDKLINGDILHGSAFEHVCRPLKDNEEQLGNLIGFRQLRHDIENELNISSFN